MQKIRSNIIEELIILSHGSARGQPLDLNSSLMNHERELTEQSIESLNWCDARFKFTNYTYVCTFFCVNSIFQFRSSQSYQISSSDLWVDHSHVIFSLTQTSTLTAVVPTNVSATYSWHTFFRFPLLFVSHIIFFWVHRWQCLWIVHFTSRCYAEKVFVFLHRCIDSKSRPSTVEKIFLFIGALMFFATGKRERKMQCVKLF